MDTVDIPKYTLDEMQGLRQYNAWMAEKIRPYLGRRVLELGSGIGNFSDYFLDRDFLMVTDITDEYLKILQEKYADRKNVSVSRYCLGGGSGYDSFKQFEFDTILCSNVLEHIRDDQQALEEMYQMFSGEGNLILLVPALTFLYGSLDKNLGHYRRYDKEDLVKKVEGAGFQVRAAFYFNFFGALGWLVHSRILKLDFIPRRTFKSAEKMIPLFKFLEGKIRVVMGQSLVVVGNKK